MVVGSSGAERETPIERAGDGELWHKLRESDVGQKRVKGWM